MTNAVMELGVSPQQDEVLGGIAEQLHAQEENTDAEVVSVNADILVLAHSGLAYNLSSMERNAGNTFSEDPEDVPKYIPEDPRESARPSLQEVINGVN